MVQRSENVYVNQILISTKEHCLSRMDTVINILVLVRSKPKAVRHKAVMHHAWRNDAATPQLVAGHAVLLNNK